MGFEDLKHHRIVFIGAGNMAEALLKGLLRSGLCSSDHIAVSDISADRLEYMQQTYGIEGYSDNIKAVGGRQIVVLSVKPQQAAEVLQELGNKLEPDTLVMSIAAGITTETIEKQLPQDSHVVRVMPNTPALIGMGVSAICAGSSASAAELDVAEVMLGCAGRVVRVKEEQMDAVTALSGSGPAYLFYFVEALMEGATRCGLSADEATVLAFETCKGAAHLLEESGETPAALREKVTSKGGTTEAALNRLKEADVSEAIARAVQRACERSRELSQQV